MLALPVLELVRQHEGILLTWTKPFDVNIIKKWVVEKSTNGQPWSPLSEHSSLDAPNSYLDQQPAWGKNYYRLSVTSRQDVVYHTPIQSIVWATKEIMVHPNPSSGAVFIPLAVAQEVLFCLYDLDGKCIQKGKALEQMNFPKGQYMLELRSRNGQFIQSTPLIIRD